MPFVSVLWSRHFIKLFQLLVLLQWRLIFCPIYTQKKCNMFFICFENTWKTCSSYVSHMFRTTIKNVWKTKLLTNKFMKNIGIEIICYLYVFNWIPCMKRVWFPYFWKHHFMYFKAQKQHVFTILILTCFDMLKHI